MVVLLSIRTGLSWEPRTWGPALMGKGQGCPKLLPQLWDSGCVPHHWIGWAIAPSSLFTCVQLLQGLYLLPLLAGEGDSETRALWPHPPQVIGWQADLETW